MKSAASLATLSNDSLATMTNENLEALSARFGILLETDLCDYKYVKEKIHVIPYSFAKAKWMLPLEEKEGFLLVALADPLDLEALEELACLTKAKLREILAPKHAIEEAIECCYHQKEDVASDFMASLHQENGDTEEAEELEGYDLLDQKADSPIIRMLNVILTEAIQQGASDIHFESHEEGLQVRYRIDGVLQKRHAPPKDYQSQLATRIKVMAQLDIAEHRLPQDGRIKLRMGGRHIDFRVSTVPTIYGERIVLRILDKSNVLVGLGKLGMRSAVLEAFVKMIHLNEGIVLVTGPTGSGKTTTLYSALSDINSSETNIMTVEDPVEYKLHGMAQMGVNPKIDLTFAKGLRHILRQDPDVIMIGEIRDKETAEIAIQASLTGHLVLSTLHTNDAPSALTRLVDMGIEPYLLSSSVIGVLAQRLVRTICPHCTTPYTPTEHELSELKLSFADLPSGKLFKGQGCARCYGTGYKGRHGIYELMTVGSAIKRQIVKSADAVMLQKVALDSGMKSLREEGAHLVCQGLTSSAEVLRVSRSTEEI
jgi:general secretion pathway protein E